MAKVASSPPWPAAVRGAAPDGEGRYGERR